MNTFSYRTDVDGLRAVSIFLVLLFHAGLGVPGGFIGVDIFFVISGFVITRLIRKEQELQIFRLSQFWLRRVRRILPASTLMVLLTLLAGYLILLPQDFKELASSAIMQQLMMANIFYWAHTGYFDGAAELKPLLHTWSLAVEEQFYFTYPVLLVCLNRFSRTIIALVVAFLMTVSFCLSVWGTRTHPDATFFWMPTRLVPASRLLRPGVSNSVSLISLAAIVGAAMNFNSNTPYPGLAALVPCLSAATLIYANSGQLNWVGTVLASRPLVSMGLLSYSLYLWHWPILSFLRYLNCAKQLDAFTSTLALILTLSVSAVTYNLIEKPIRDKRLLASEPSLLRWIGLFALVLLTGSQAVVWLNGLPERFDRRVVAFEAARNRKGNRFEIQIATVHQGKLPLLGAKDSSRQCLLWGDSHAMSLGAGLDLACKIRNIKGFQATHSSTPPILNYSERNPYGLNERAPEFNQAVMIFAKERKINMVVIAPFWSLYLQDHGFEENLSQTINELTAAGIQVALVLDVPEHSGDPLLKLAMAARKGQDTAKIGAPQAKYKSDNLAVNTLLKRFASDRVQILDPLPYLSDEDGILRAEFGGEAIYWDKDHLTIEGSLRLVPMFEKWFDSLKLTESTEG